MENSWAWCRSGDEQAHGTFDTREEAVKDADEYFSGVEGDLRKDVVFGHPLYPDPETYLPSVEDIMERMDQWACDSDFGWCDDPIFELVGNEKEAEEALHAALKVWSDKYVVGSGCWTFVPEKEVSNG